MKLKVCILLAALTFCPLTAIAEPRDVPQFVPHYKHTQTLVAAADASMPADMRYLAFPAVLDLGDEVLVSIKRGRSHASDPGAVLEVLRYNGAAERVTQRSHLAGMDGQIMQMGEWARFPNGHIANYIDVQQKAALSRLGLRVVRSTDGGKSFGAVERVGVIDGVEYGYAFEAITHGKSTWMLVMTFSNLTGGKSVYPQRPAAGSVDIIRTDDNGASWQFVRSITGELGGAPINESSFAHHRDGFIVAARGYDNRQWLLRTDGEFRLQKKLDLTKAYSFINSYVGRPRVFTRDGRWYLIGRNWTGAPAASGPREPMRLSLFRFDPESLEIDRHVLLDNLAGENVSDGYYAAPFWRDRGGRTYLNVVTYKRTADRLPDIIRLEFDWEEVR